MEIILEQTPNLFLGKLRLRRKRELEQLAEQRGGNMSLLTIARTSDITPPPQATLWKRLILPKCRKLPSGAGALGVALQPGSFSLPWYLPLTYVVTPTIISFYLSLRSP